MFKFNLVSAVVAGLVLAGSTAFGGPQDQTQPVSKKGQPQQVSTKPMQTQPVGTKGQVPAKAKGQEQTQEQTSVKPTQPIGKGKGKVIGKTQKLKKTQPQPLTQPQPRPQQPTQPQPMPQ